MGAVTDEWGIPTIGGADPDRAALAHAVRAAGLAAEAAAETLTAEDVADMAARAARGEWGAQRPEDADPDRAALGYAVRSAGLLLAAAAEMLGGRADRNAADMCAEAARAADAAALAMASKDI